MRRRWFTYLLLVGSTLLLTAADVAYRPGQTAVPALSREFRGAWIATVNNIDWPSKPGLPVAEQQKELADLIDSAAQLKLNCLIFQVRPACDALYPSTLEPWSEYLTGKMGQAPQPLWDPLAYAIREAHRRGMELHAWFNPYRARYKSAKGPAANGHISRTHPQLVRSYDGYQWLDPAEPAAAAHSLKVILDVTRRYDVDGIHIDDYFYPYPAANRAPFPDEASWKTFQGDMDRKEWRRMHINNFIKRLHTEIHKIKPHVKFGISPFGIWRPGYPKQIKGLDAYGTLYADARLWLREGWLDYCAPQLYWRIDPPAQSYPVLLQWWHEQNPKRRHLWPGNNSAKVEPWPATEILNQIDLTRKHPGTTGNIHWNLSALVDNRGKLGTQLMAQKYQHPALLPASPWLGRIAPKTPAINASWDNQKKMIHTTWRSVNREGVRWWLFQIKANGRWISKLMPGAQKMALLRVTDQFPGTIAVTAINAAGIASAPATLLKR